MWVSVFLLQWHSHFCQNVAPFDIFRFSHHFFHFATSFVTLSYTKRLVSFLLDLFIVNLIYPHISFDFMTIASTRCYDVLQNAAAIITKAQLPFITNCCNAHYKCVSYFKIPSNPYQNTYVITKECFKNKEELSEMMRHKSSSTYLEFSYSSLKKGSHLRIKM